MRIRLLPVALAVALLAPTAVALLTETSPAGAVSTTAAWTINTNLWNRSSSPTIADINNDRVPEIIIGHQDGWLRVMNGNGAELPGWPQRVVVAGSAITSVDSTPAVGDLYRNGQKQIVVGAGSTWYRHQQGGVVVFNSNGSVHCRFRTLDNTNLGANQPGADGYSEGVYSSPAIGDINGDGYPDIVFGAWDRHVYGIDRACHKILDMDVEDTVWSSPALYDVNGDGRQDILIGNDQFAGGFDNWSGGEFRAISWMPGNGARQLWIHKVNDTVWSSPAVGDIDGDGRVEVVVGGGSFYNRSDGKRVFAWHADDGSTVRGWPINTAGSTMSSAALGDLNGDGIPEVAVSSADGVMRAYRGNGSIMWARHLLFNNSSPGGGLTPPIIADLNSDGHNDVVVGNNWGFFVLDGRNGNNYAQIGTWQSYGAAAAVGHFGSLGWRVIVSGFSTPAHTSRLQAYTMGAPKTTAPWPMFRREPSHIAGPVGKNLLKPGFCRRATNGANHPSTLSSRGYWVLGADGSVYSLHGAPYKGNARGRVHGIAVGIAATHSGGGYYILDSGGNIITFGDAHSYGSMRGAHLNAPIVALAPTPSGHGYWLMGRDGGIFGFGDARFYGSMGGKRLNAPIISLAATKSGHGYWLLASDGGIFGFGDARFHGSTGGLRLNAPIISMATAPSGAGYWLVARDGGIFGFNVPFYGSLPGLGFCHPPAGTQIRPSKTGHGYFILTAEGRVFGFGDAWAPNSAPFLNSARYGIDLAVRP